MWARCEYELPCISAFWRSVCGKSLDNYRPGASHLCGSRSSFRYSGFASSHERDRVQGGVCVTPARSACVFVHVRLVGLVCDEVQAESPDFRAKSSDAGKSTLSTLLSSVAFTIPKTSSRAPDGVYYLLYPLQRDMPLWSMLKVFRLHKYFALEFFMLSLHVPVGLSLLPGSCFLLPFTDSTSLSDLSTSAMVTQLPPSLHTTRIVPHIALPTSSLGIVVIIRIFFLFRVMGDLSFISLMSQLLAGLTDVRLNWWFAARALLARR